MGRPSLFSASEAARLCGGVHYPSGGRDRIITGLAVDSRAVTGGDLFVALEGERVDGHSFIPQAVESGAAAVLVADSGASRYSPGGEGWERAAAGYKVDIISTGSPLEALQRLGAAYLDRFPSLVRIAVTGSSGKTTTKELLGSVLGRYAPTAVNEGNLNSDIGLPLALFAVRGDDRFGVFELGINRVGEMDQIAAVFRPDYALITNFGTAHAGPLGGAEGVFREKGRVFAHMRRGGTAFIPEDEQRAGRLRELYPEIRFVPYGPAALMESGLLESAENLGAKGWLLRLRGRDIRFPLLGAHNFGNACGVLAVCEELGIDMNSVAEGLESASAMPGRSRLLPGGIAVLDDSYNANLDSSRKVFDYLSSLPWEGRKIVVFGSMKELGDETAAAHAEAGRAVSSSGADAAFFFGSETEVSAQSLRGTAFGGQVGHFGDEEFDRLSAAVAGFCRPGDLVLLKGSRAMGLERLIPVLQGKEDAAHV